MLLGTVGITALADDAEYSGSYEDKMTWSYDTDTKTLSINCDGPLDFPYNIKYEEYYDMGELQKMFIYKEYPWYTNGFASQVEHVELSGNVTEIGEDVFYRFVSLQEFTIPETVTKIGGSAFSGCSKITQMTVPAGVREIGTAAFANMSELVSITLPENLESLGGYAFSFCRKLTDMTLPHHITHIGPRLFGSDTSTPAENGVAEFEDGVMYSGEYALACYNKGSEVAIREGTVLMADEFFLYAGTESKNVTLPGTLKYIGNSAFQHSYIKNITLPDGLETIGDDAFMGTQISSINIPSGVTAIPKRAFVNTNLESVYLHKGIQRVSADAFDSTKLTAVTVDKENPYYCAQDGVLFNKKKTSIVVYPEMRDAKHYNIPDTVNTLYTAFSGKLETVAFPKSIKNCYKRVLKKIYYFGTEEEFAKILFPPKTSYDYYDRIVAKCCKAKLSKTRYLYNKKAHTPSVKVYDAAGNRLKEKVDYKVALPTGRTKIGIYTVKVTLKGKFKGSFYLDYKIVPKGTEIEKLKAGVSSFTVKWKKQAQNITGYQVQYSKSDSFKTYGTTSIFINKPKATKKTVKNLSVDQKYYVRVRTYKTVGENKIYSKWSKVKKVKVTRPF